MELVFSNVPGWKLHTWVRVVSNTHASRTAIFQNISKQLFQLFSQIIFHMHFSTCMLLQKFRKSNFLEHFRKIVSIIQLNHFSHAFCNTLCLSCSTCFSLFLDTFPFTIGKFNFVFNFRYSRDTFRTPVKDLRWSFLQK